MKPNITTKDIIYRCPRKITRSPVKKSIEVIGLDTEADRTGKCFMLATSWGDVFSIEQFPACFFTRKYRQRNFVAYNLKYDEGAMIRELSKTATRQLWETGKCEYQGYIYVSIPGKCLTIRRGKHCVHIYDMYNFYQKSLAYNAEKYLGMKKLDIDVQEFTTEYIQIHWAEIAKYCVQDAIIVEKLANLIIKRFEQFGVHPRKLYSTAYVSYQYFKQKCPYVTVRRYWDRFREVLDFAMLAYNGGKFEVSEKGSGYFYEYDIVSAYPYEIANLANIDWARVYCDRTYHKSAVYGFLYCKIAILDSIFSPCSIKMGTVNVYPCGYYEKVITKNEYDYLIVHNAKVEILKAFWIHLDKKQYPYRREIQKLVKLKSQYKNCDHELEYHTIKILLNSLYGKFCQLIPKKYTLQTTKGNFRHNEEIQNISTETKYVASACWNPIYAAIITANVRIRMAEMQNTFDSVIAVHTDSIISKTKLPFPKNGELGDMIYDVEGEGVILGSGIYQIGHKSKFRGFRSNTDLLNLVAQSGDHIDIVGTHAITWKEAAFHNWENDRINLFTDQKKTITPNFDRKRLWLNDYTDFSQVLKRNVQSLPLYLASNGFRFY